MDQKANHVSEREKTQYDECRTSKIIRRRNGEFLIEGKEVHIEGYVPPSK